MAFFRAVMLEGERRRRKRRREMGRKRQRREMCRKSQELIPEIPFDLVTEILTKLPAKSLMRFKSVSKLWSSLIRSRTFTNRVQRVSSSSLRLYLTMNFFDHNSHPQIELLSTSSSSSAPLSSDNNTTMSSFVIETNPGMIGYYLAHVFNGLMCFAKEQSSKIYNTTTRQLVVLPDIEESNVIVHGHKHQSITFRIGHDPVCDQYKVVCIIARLGDRETRTHTFVSEHWVFLLGGGDQSTSRWRKIPCPSPPHLPVTNIISNINGRMHYYLGLVELLYPPMLVSFDFSSEEICLIQVPEDIHDDLCISTTYFYAIEYYGKVALLDHSHLKSQGMMKLWVLEDAHEKNMWSNKTLVVHPSQMDQVTSIGLRVQGTTRNNEIIFVPYNPTGESQDTTLAYIFLYHLQKNLIRKLEINETPYHTNIWDVVGFDDDVDNFMYL